MDSKRYDKYLIQSIGTTHIKPGTSYYDDDYEQALTSLLKRSGCLSRYGRELSKKTKEVRMCSVGSSARLCFLASKTDQYGITEVEKCVSNGVCRPHFDAYDANTKTYYEFKCHELCRGSHSKLTSMEYIPLLKKYFNIECDDPTKLQYSDFGFKERGSRWIHQGHFDFKQLICHIIGLLGMASKDNPISLKYVWVVPCSCLDDGLKAFVTDVEKESKDILDQMARLQTCLGRLGDLIHLTFETKPIVEIDDPIIDELRHVSL